MCDEGRRVMAVKLTPEEKRYDIGNFPSYFESFVEFALADPLYGAEFRRVLERLLAKSAVSVESRQALNRDPSRSSCCWPPLLVAARHVPRRHSVGRRRPCRWPRPSRCAPARCSTATSGSISRRSCPRCTLRWGARPGWPLRLGGALYALLCCWIA